MAKNDFQYGGWTYYTLQCGTWHWDHDTEFARWQHTAMWHVVLGSWHSIHQVAVGLYHAKWHVAVGWHVIECARWQHPAMWLWNHDSEFSTLQRDNGSGMTCHWIRPNVRHIVILLIVSISTISLQSTSFCTSLRNFIQIRPPTAEKYHVMSIFKMADAF